MFEQLDAKSDTAKYILEIAWHMAKFGFRPEDDRRYYEIVLEWAKEWYDLWAPAEAAEEVHWQFYFESTSQFVREKILATGQAIPPVVSYETHLD